MNIRHKIIYQIFQEHKREIENIRIFIGDGYEKLQTGRNTEDIA